MRRIAAAVLVPLAACAVLAGCGGSGSGNANNAVSVTGSFGNVPKVAIPAEKASANLVISTPIKGSGAALKSGNLTLADVFVYKWSGTKHTLVDSTASSGPQVIPGNLGLPGLVTALKGARMGTRVVAVLPPKYGYGTGGNTQLQVKGTDTLVWVIDLLQQYTGKETASGAQRSAGGGALPAVTTKPGQAPVVTVPTTAPPSALSVTTLIQGTGPKLAKGETVVAQFVGSIWRTGKVFASSWPSAQAPSGQLFGFKLGGDVLQGWNQALPGITVGSRVMLVIPPALGYGPEGGDANAGINATDSLVFVIDIVGYRPAAS
jgi:FKBP-type peptidyl-prolyl cis-trans isomerase